MTALEVGPALEGTAAAVVSELADTDTASGSSLDQERIGVFFTFASSQSDQIRSN